MSKINRRHFLAAGAGIALLPAAMAASSNQDDRSKMKDRIDVSAPVEDNLIAQYLKPKKLSIAVGAAKPFAALHFSDSHISMADAADILWGTSKELRLYEARNNGSLAEAGFPHAVQTLAAVIAYAKRKNIPLLNTGDIIDFLRGRKNLKAILCGHLHMEWHGVFGEGVPVHVAGRGFNGECYEISFV